MKGFIQFVIFILRLDNKDVYFGVPMKQVREIYSADKLTPAPRELGFVKGIFNLRGSDIPIIDLKKMFYTSDERHSNKSKIIVFDLFNNKTGIMVDEFCEVLQVPKHWIEMDPAIIGTALQYISGMTKLDNRIIILLDLKRLVSHPETERIHTMAL